MRYAKHIGRVGGLAIALGVGLGIGPVNGIPLAHATESGADSSSTDGVSTPTDNTAGTPASPSTHTTTPTDTASTDGATSGDGDGDNDGAVDDEAGDDDGTGATEDDVAVNSADTPIDDDGDDEAASTDEGLDSEDTRGTEETETDDGGQGDSSYDGDDASYSDIPAATDLASDADDESRFAASNITEAGGFAAGGVDDEGGAENSDLDVEFDSASTISTLVEEPAAVDPPAQDAVSRLVSGLMSWVGLGPSATENPLDAPVESPLAWGLLAWVRRSFQDGVSGFGGGVLPKQIETSEPATEGRLKGKAAAAAANNGPVADDETYTVAEDGTLTVPAPTGVLAGDTDADGNSLEVVDNTSPLHGTVTVSANGALTYTPAANYNGTDTFDYTVSDGIGGTDVGTVTINVTAVNDAPVANSDSYTVAEGTKLTVPVATGALANDTDIDGDTVKAVAATQPANGRIVGWPDGSFNYTPDAGFSGVDTFTYTISDGKGKTATGTVTINVTAVNTAPVAGGGTVTADEDTAVTGTLAGTDADGDALTYTITQAPTNGTVTGFDPATGAYTYTPNANYNGADSFNYVVSDGTATSAQATVNITVNAVNDVPVAGGGTLTTTGGTAVNGTLPATDVDGQTLTYTITQAPAHGSISGLNPATGSYTYTPGANYSGPDAFTYVVSDGTATSAQATVNINVNAVSEAPVIQSVTSAAPDTSTGAVTYTVTVTDPDTALGDLDFTVSPPADGTGTVSEVTSTVPGTYTFTYTPNQLARFTAGSTLPRDYDSIAISVSDGATAVDAAVVVEIYSGTTAVSTFPMLSWLGPTAMIADGDRLYVANTYSNRVAVFDSTTGTFLANIAVGSRPTSLALSADGQTLYVANRNSNTVSVINTATSGVVATMSVTAPRNVAVSSDGTRLYVTNTTNKVTVLDTATGTTVASITVGTTPTGVAVNSDGSRVYVANKGSGTVSVIDATTNTVIETLAVGSSPQGVALTNDGTRLYVTNTGSGTVSVIDTDTLATISTITTGPSPNGIVMGPDGTVAYVSHANHTVSVLDTVSNAKVTGTIVAETGSAGMVAVSPDGNKLWVSSSSGYTIRTVSLVHKNEPPPPTANPNTGAYFDDFDGPAGSVADPNVWTPLLGAGGLNGQVQAYTNYPTNASLDGNGNLVITAREETVTDPFGGVWNYTSAWLETKDKLEFTYGTLTARIQFPTGQGLHPAFWMVGSDFDTVGWPTTGEIDILDMYNDAQHAGSGLHGPGGYAIATPAPIDISDGFHEFSLKWEPNKITTYVDGQVMAVYTPDSLPPGTPWTFNDRSMYVILNIAVGGMHGQPDDTTPFPVEMVVDWISYTPLESVV